MESQAVRVHSMSTNLDTRSAPTGKEVMSHDLIVRFSRSNPRPTLKVLRMFLEDFVAGVGAVTWGESRFYVNFAGHPSHAYRRCDIRGQEVGEEWHTHLSSDHGNPRERWIEVWSNRSVVCVMTRDQDQFVNGIARQLAMLIAHRWDGKFDQ